MLSGRCMHDISLPLPPLVVVRVAVAAVWLYEGLWCKILGGERHQVQVVEAVPKLGPLVGKQFLFALGLVETSLAVWVMSGVAPGFCAVVQTVVLITLNANGLIWARHIIHDPGGMVVKNTSFLLLAWVGAAMSGGAL
ncbi:MAG: DoxX-like family protein [Polyangiaceae bacterium]